MKRLIRNTYRRARLYRRRFSGRQKRKQQMPSFSIILFLKDIFTSSFKTLGSKIVIGAILALSGWGYYELIQNPIVPITITGQVVDYHHPEVGIKGIPIYFEGFKTPALTGENGLFEMTLNCRKNDKTINISCGGEYPYILMEKTIDVPLDQPRIFETTFYLENLTFQPNQQQEEFSQNFNTIYTK